MCRLHRCYEFTISSLGPRWAKLGDSRASVRPGNRKASAFDVNEFFRRVFRTPPPRTPGAVGGGKGLTPESAQPRTLEFLFGVPSPAAPAPKSRAAGPALPYPAFFLFGRGDPGGGGRRASALA